MLAKIIIFVGLLSLCHAQWYRHLINLFRRDQSDWNGLKVTWGLNPITSFNNVPRTKADAVNEGYEKIGTAACDGNAKFRGERYMKGSDQAVILIFDQAGQIAGMQGGVPKQYKPGKENDNGFPKSAIINKPMVLDGDHYYVTVYFVDPATLCLANPPIRSTTGTGLWIQNGTNPVTDSVMVPMTQAEADTSEWTKGACFWTMGVHYWYKLSKEMNCDNFFPMFLLYNDGKLNAFGWAFGMNLGIDYSRRTEHPPRGSYGNFMLEESKPTCLASRGTLTTMHIYLTNSATEDRC